MRLGPVVVVLVSAMKGRPLAPPLSLSCTPRRSPDKMPLWLVVVVVVVVVGVVVVVVEVFVLLLLLLSLLVDVGKEVL